jgi:cell division protein FtsI (penicillin-binding protein 3)
MSSVQDHHRNNLDEARDKDKMNRGTVDVYEMGSTFNGFTTAMALDSGRVKISDSFDARGTLQVGRHTISDFHGKHRVLTVPEIFIFSSNIGTAKMALAAGTPEQESFLKKIGLLDPMRTELPEVGAPIVPKMPWSKISTITISFGHGISVSPMQTAAAGAALINGGLLIPPTFLPRTPEQAASVAHQVIRPETSEIMRHLFRLNVIKGSGKRASVPGYSVGGKTGTAQIAKPGGGYYDNQFNGTYVGFVGGEKPDYVIVVFVNKPTNGGYAGTAAAQPIFGDVAHMLINNSFVTPKGQ